jgi:hypothetical protein
MNVFSGLSQDEGKEIWDQVWKEEFARGQRSYSLCRYTFRAFFLTAEKDLEMRGQLALFRRTQRLPDYPRAEDAIKRGWATWLQQEFRIGPNEATDYLAMHQFLLLYGLRCDKSREARQERERRSSKLIAACNARDDKEFFRRLRHVRAEPPRKREGYREFVQVLLANWLTSFWWLTPLKVVAYDMARIDGKANDSKAINNRYQNLRQITTRRKPPSPGAFFSAGYNGVFYSTKPPLVKDITPNGSPQFNYIGKRLLG